MQILAAIAIAIGSLIAVFNWSTIFLSRPDRHVSPAPLIGALLLGLGLAGFNLTRPYWWTAALLDYGTLMPLIALPWMVYEAWSHSDRNVEHRFTCDDDDRTITIRLFRDGTGAIEIAFDPHRPHGDPGNPVVSRCFAVEWSSDTNGWNITNYAGGRRLQITAAEKAFYTIESYPDGESPSYDSLGALNLKRKPDSGK